MRRAKLAVQKAEYDWQLSIFPHSIRNTHTGIQAGERGSNQCNHYGYCQDSGEGDTVPAKHLVAENLRHVGAISERPEIQRENVFLIAADVADQDGISNIEASALGEIAAALRVDGVGLLRANPVRRPPA